MLFRNGLVVQYVQKMQSKRDKRKVSSIEYLVL